MNSRIVIDRDASLIYLRLSACLPASTLCCCRFYVVAWVTSHPTQVWRAASRSPLSNLSLLDAMVAARHEQARLVGSPSYAQYKAHGARCGGANRP
jgi:hypothetical protein